MRKITLNADLGEGDENDNAILSLIDWANIACGGHAGTHESMYNTIIAAKKNNVVIGAHPSYEDQENFGRISKNYSSTQLTDIVSKQLFALNQIATELGCEISHIKPHGALYHDVAIHPTIASAFIEACLALKKPLKIISSQNSVLLLLAEKTHLHPVVEGFIDRRYQDNGQLLPRNKKEAVIHDIELACKQALQLAQEQSVQTINNNNLEIQAKTLCVHGDTPAALAILKKLSHVIAPYRAHSSL